MRRREQPTKAAKRVLEAIREMQAAGELPTIRRLAARLDLWPNPVAESIQRLVDLGWLRRGKLKPGRHRAIIEVE